MLPRPGSRLWAIVTARVSQPELVGVRAGGRQAVLGPVAPAKEKPLSMVTSRGRRREVPDQLHFAQVDLSVAEQTLLQREARAAVARRAPRPLVHPTFSVDAGEPRVVRLEVPDSRAHAGVRVRDPVAPRR